MTLPSRTTSDVDKYSYDDAYYLSAIASKHGSTLLASCNYSRSSDELVTSSVAAGQPKATYSYDAVDQMSKASGGSYSYDPAGNLTKSPSIAPLSYNAGDELSTSGTGSHKTTYAYNGEGDRISQSTNGKITTSFRYDEANRLVGFTSGSKSTSYVFNGNGQWMSRKDRVGGDCLRMGHRCTDSCSAGMGVNILYLRTRRVASRADCSKDRLLLSP